MTKSINWIGNEDEQFAERMKACKARPAAQEDRADG